MYSETEIKAFLWTNDFVTGTVILLVYHCLCAADDIYSSSSLQATTFQSTTRKICFPEFFQIKNLITNS